MMQSTPENETTSTPMIAVDVTGATFSRQCTYLEGLRPTSRLAVTELDYTDDDHTVQFARVVRGPPPTSRRSSGVSADYGFSAGRDVVCRVPSTRQQTAVSAETTNRRRATSETREYHRHRRQEMMPSTSTATSPSVTADSLQQTRGRTTIRQLKRKNNRTRATSLSAAANRDNSGICSWRHSLCAGFKSSKCDVEDLCPESRPEPAPSRLPSTSSSVTVHVVASAPRTPTPSRSQSLPRSLRSSFMAPLRRLLSSRSLSSTSDVDTGSRVAERLSSQRLVSSVSDSASSRRLSRAPASTTMIDAQPTTKSELVRRSKSLERGPSRDTQQRPFSRATSLNNRSAVSSQSRRNASTSSSSSGTREVYVEIPDQPWTRPFSTVQLRPHRAGDVDRYQSSSGRRYCCFVFLDTQFFREEP